MRTKNLFNFMLTAFIFCAFTSAGYAQSVEKEIKKLTQSFTKAYNAKDHAALTAMFTTDAVRIDADGKTTTGAASIGEGYAQSFSATEQKVDIKLGTVKEDGEGKATSTGTYTVAGSVKSSGEKIAIAGAYENTLVKENGQWKISQMKLKSVQ